MNRFLFQTAQAWMLVALLALAACSGTETATSDGERRTEPEFDLSEYEDFDARPYREEPPAAAAPERLEHDVPDALMESQAGAGQIEQRQGFRIQLSMSLNRDEADEARSRFTSWWQEQRAQSQDSLNAPPSLPTYMRYQQPYYRVRVGNFTSRAQAERYLGRIQGEFSSASIVPSTVSVRR